jgi:anti-sigma-K factor RskA
MSARKGLSPMSDVPKPSDANPVLEMPWVLISNQIQQLNDNLNQRFNDERLRMDERFAALERRTDDRFAALERRIDDRFAAQDQRLAAIEQRLNKLEQDTNQRFDKLERRLEFRVSTWLAIVIAALTLIIGVLIGHPVHW